MTTDGIPQQPPPSQWEARWAAIKGSPRIIILTAIILGIFVIFGRRVWHLQFVQGAYYSVQADRRRLRTEIIPTSRGIIYDRAGAPLVRNVPSFKITVTPAYLPDDETEAEAVLIRLAVLLNIPYTTSDDQVGLREIMAEAWKVPYHPAEIEGNVAREKALLVAQESLLLPGVSLEVDSAREYPYGPLLSQMLGYLLPIPGEYEKEYREQGYDPSTDRIGRTGIEATYEDSLRGEKGESLVEEDVMGRAIRVVSQRAAPVLGNNVNLTLDLELQQFVEKALRQRMTRPNVNSPRGVVIVMNPQTGEILAMVSLPTYDNNLFTQGISTQDLQTLSENVHRPMLNHAISDRLQPGSVFKIIIAAGALQEKVLDGQRTRLNGTGTIVIPNKYYPNDPGQAQKFHCWNRAGHGWLDVVGGIAHSCNIFFYKAGGGFEEDDFEGLGMDEESGIPYYAHLFGFGEPTGIELTGEIGGTVPTRNWKRLTYGESWSTGNTYHFAIGEGFLQVTPLQMLNAVNVVANGGTLYRPRVVHHVTDADGNTVQPFEPEIIRTLPISQENWSLIQQGMEGAVAYGTAPNAQIEGVRVAGKTGTAQYCDDIARETGVCRVGYKLPEHAWFAAFAPVEKPEISVIVFIYNGGEGSTNAVPVAHDILDYYFNGDDGDSDNGNDETAP
ncbi:MAG: penicillin-binding protein 2 [Chloroflexota bacterium]|nr:penicillin-binding protein 2 [Chloroflexota bacterium]